MFQGKKKERAKDIRQKRNKILKLVNQNKKIYRCYLYDFYLLNFLKFISRTSLVVQWLRICLTMQETNVQSLVQEDRTFWGN